jgi:ditrans,polycis-polyprenyl diphosphate synthase
MNISNILRLLTFLPGFSILEGAIQNLMINILKTGPIPKHISFVMDGNRRFAKTYNLPLKEGHGLGAEALIKVLDCCFKLGIKNVTAYAFSIENFNRKAEEVDTIFSLLKYKLAFISKENQLCDLHNVKIKIIGNRSYLPLDILNDIEIIEQRTKNNSKHTLFIALPYTSRDDMWFATSQIVEKYLNNEINLNEINEILYENNFYYEEAVEKVDILVRTSGHTRLSDYMLWQCHQDSVIEYPNTLWPNYRFYNVWWTIFKWSYFKTLIIQDAEIMQIKKLNKLQIDKKYKDLPNHHPPFASVTKA